MSVLNLKKRKKIMIIPAWYPSETNPVHGIFIKEQAKASSLYNEVLILYVYPNPNTDVNKLYQSSESIEDGMRTIRVKYRSSTKYFKKITSQISKENYESNNNAPNTRNFNIINKICNYLDVLIYYWGNFKAFRKLLKQGWKPDIINAHVFTAGVPAIILGKIYRIPVLISEHYSGFIKKDLRNIDKCKAKFSMNNASAILPVSKGLKVSIQNYKIKNKFYIIPNTYDKKIFYPTKIRIKKEKIKMLLVANITPIKGIDYLLKSINYLKLKRNDFQLDIVGDGPSKEEYETMAMDLGLGEIVNFHGQKTNAEVAIYMRNCDFFVQPSLFETFGVVYIEAMGCGKPIIGTKTVGPLEIINENVGILIPPKNVNSLVDALNFMLDNYENYSSEDISKFACKNFSYEPVGKQLNEVYLEFVKEL
ncbi:glycosyltransferase [Methanobacterium sp. BAmetb5]|uniref:glycosyltransferase n=1 Tax=Methanobacterium sp. BAmetb5 TaxID=2025351 RepID=UPI000E85A777|nr:glycosyltransferase [Methanobacterium sp. BAmetb5]AXV40954.1 MAG: hypothetical protein CIT02_11825 [Methanobacterium sp. BAmetb5]